jgi:predicted ArsR family transcriptional regulator
MTQDSTGLAALSGLGDPVRSRLYEFVSGRDEPAGRDEAAAAVGIGRPLAAYHLDKLVELGLLTASYQRAHGQGGPGAGRPAKVYIRSGREFAVTVPPREYELAARLLAQAVESDRGGASRAALHDAARQFGAELGRRSRPGGAGEPAARQALESVLREHGFEPWHDEEGTIRLRNCPFHQLAARHPELVCGMNLELIKGLVADLGADGMRAALDPGPGRCCAVIGTGASAGETWRTQAP